MHLQHFRAGTSPFASFKIISWYASNMIRGEDGNYLGSLHMHMQVSMAGPRVFIINVPPPEVDCDFGTSQM